MQLSRQIQARHVAAVACGNALEFYDFLTYAFFAVQIGHSFFPSHSATASLLASLATFGAGFLTRPLGALVIGRIADRRGRKPAMLLSFSLIGLAVTGLALTPSYASIGVAAPILAIGFRMLQGFALGGEVGPSTAYLIEAAPPLRRGLYTALQSMSADFAVLVAGLVGILLSSVMDKSSLDAWGWRIALLAGVAIVPFGLWLRRDLDETLHRPDPDPTPTPRHRLPIAVLGVVLLASATINNYTLDYLTTYAATTLAMPTRVAFGATVFVGLAGVICDPLGGWLSDRYGRKTLLIAPACLLLAILFPCFRLLAEYRTPWALYTAGGLLAACSTLSSVSTIVVITESLPRRIRSVGLGLIYAGTIATFGGSTQFIIAWAIAVTGSPLVPAWYMAGFLVLSLAAMLCLQETSPSAQTAIRPRGPDTSE